LLTRHDQRHDQRHDTTHARPHTRLQIGRGLRENRSVTTLKLSGNEFDKKGAMALAEALEANRTLQHLALARCGLPKVTTHSIYFSFLINQLNINSLSTLRWRWWRRWWWW
jgi:Ran GTPase-activating protein (RanGAP) involved in mRNA processing and transport